MRVDKMDRYFSEVADFIGFDSQNTTKIYIMKDFSIESGIAIQNSHLKEWESVLLPEVAKKLREWAESTNSEAKSGYDIKRGQELTTYIQNNLMVR